MQTNTLKRTFSHTTFRGDEAWKWSKGKFLELYFFRKWPSLTLLIDCYEFDTNNNYTRESMCHFLVPFIFQILAMPLDKSSLLLSFHIIIIILSYIFILSYIPMARSLDLFVK